MPLAAMPALPKARAPDGVNSSGKANASDGRMTERRCGGRSSPHAIHYALTRWGTETASERLCCKESGHAGKSTGDFQRDF